MPFPGVGLGLAIAKQQSALFEQKLLDMAAAQQKNRRGGLRSQPTPNTGTAGWGTVAFSPNLVSMDENNPHHHDPHHQSFSEESPRTHSSHTIMSQAGAMVIQKKPSSSMSDNSQRKFL